MAIAAMVQSASPVRKAVYVHSIREATVAQCPTTCASCTLHSTCLPCGLQQADDSMDELVYSRRRIHRGEHLYRAGDPFKFLYAFRSGFFKSYIDTPEGQTQVTAFPMAGDVLGLDGIETERHRVSTVALEDGEVCMIPFAHFQAVALRSPALLHQMHRMMSREIMREQSVMALLGGMRAESRVAAFLLALSEKFAARGYSAMQFNLRMTREDIGSYLGLKLETVSRVLSRFQATGLIKAHLRSIEIVDMTGLKSLVPEL